MLLFEALVSGFLLTLVQVSTNLVSQGRAWIFLSQMRQYVGCAPRGPVEPMLSGTKDNQMEQIMKVSHIQIWNDERELCES